MDCPFEKETSFGRDKGYRVCMNPNVRFRHCNPESCGRALGAGETLCCGSQGSGVVVSDSKGTRRVCKKAAANMLMDFFEGALEQTGGYDIDGIGDAADWI